MLPPRSLRLEHLIEQNPAGDTQELGEVSALQIFLGDATDDAPTLNKSAALQVSIFCPPVRVRPNRCSWAVSSKISDGDRCGIADAWLTFSDVPSWLRVPVDSDDLLEVGPESDICLQLFQG